MSKVLFLEAFLLQCEFILSKDDRIDGVVYVVGGNSCSIKRKKATLKAEFHGGIIAVRAFQYWRSEPTISYDHIRSSFANSNPVSLRIQ